MKTLIELYDNSPVKNVIGTEMFRPEETVLLCPPELASVKALKSSLEKYFEYRGCRVKLTLVQVSLLDASRVERTLREIVDSREDCAIDISGGTDASLFAAGAVSADRDVAVYTYSFKKNTFFEIKNAAFAKDCPCSVTLDVRSCFLMAGGSLLEGRSAGVRLTERLDQIDALFEIYKKFRRGWRSQILYMQQISSSEHGCLEAAGKRTIMADHSMVSVDEQLLRALHGSGLIRDLKLSQEAVSFRFADESVRFWLRDIGAVLELKVYRDCLEAGCFDDVEMSAVVNWEGGQSQRNAVTNEIDVMAIRGIRPLFISCKTCEIKTEALNELAVLRDRFGGKESRAMIVTSANATKSRSLMRLRAKELYIEVVEWEDLAQGRLPDILGGKILAETGGRK